LGRSIGALLKPKPLGDENHGISDTIRGGISVIRPSNSEAMTVILIKQEGESLTPLYPPHPQPDTDEWFAWLDDERVSAFALSDDWYYTDDILCTVHKVQRKTGGYWYIRRKAHTQRGTKYRTMSVGRSKEVTLQRLWNTVHILIKKELREDGHTTRQQ
jgi:hypothetical protein